MVEEIESLGRREKHEVYARVLRILEHMLKLHLATGPLLESNQRGWRAPAERQRSELSRLFEDSPSLRGLVDAELIAKAYRDAAHIVALEHDLAPAPDCAYGVRAVLGR